MKEETKIILIVGILMILIINITRVVWKITENGQVERERIACLQGGGIEVLGGFNNYLYCEKSPPNTSETGIRE
jgi:hypothetical protein